MTYSTHDRKVVRLLQSTQIWPN